MKEEYIIIENFGPITKADIIIKPFMVFIGESGSGKSIVLKLLSLLRWIAKKNHLKEFARKMGVKEYYRFRLERILKDSGLEEFFNEKTYICYKGQREEILLKKDKLNIKTTTDTTENKMIFLEKISFITDDRFSLISLLNGQIKGMILPYHLRKTQEDFNEAFENLSETKELNIQTMDLKIFKAKNGIIQRYFLENQGAKTQLHNSSSGMKSISIIEPILQYFSSFYDETEDFNGFLIELFTKGNFKDPDEFFKKIPNLENKDFRLNFFIEEPELSLFPTTQKRLVGFFSEVFHRAENIHIAFSTHSPYMLSVLNCFLKADELAKKESRLNKEIEKIIPKNQWLSLEKFGAYKLKDGKIINIIDKETRLILADEIDEVSEEISGIFDNLLDLEYE